MSTEQSSRERALDDWWESVSEDAADSQQELAERAFCDGWDSAIQWMTEEGIYEMGLK